MHCDPAKEAEAHGHVQWFARGENTILGRTTDYREWFLVEECEDVCLESDSRILDIEYLPVKILRNGESRVGPEQQS